VLEQEEGVGDASPLPLRDQAGLEVQGGRVGHTPEMADFQGAQRARALGYSADSSNSWRPFLRCAMKRSASAPSTIRWSKLRAR
jgi:hypothetical protein